MGFGHEVAYAGSGLQEDYYASLAECGCIDLHDDARTRNCRVVKWLDPGSGTGIFSVPFTEEINCEKTESFCTAWGNWDLENLTNETFTFNIQQIDKRLYRLSDASGRSVEENYVVRLGLVSAQLLRNNISIDVKVEYLGNGLIFLREAPQSGDVLTVELLTTMEPCVFYGRRGELTGYEIF